MKPKLPNKAAHDFNLVKRNTWNALMDCVAYAMEHPRGDGTTILNLGDGNMRIARRTASGGTASGGSSGMFTLVSQGNSICVMDTSGNGNAESAGIAHVNNQPFSVASFSFPLPEEGTTYVYLHYDASSLLEVAQELAGITYNGTTAAAPSLALETSSQLLDSSFQHTYYLIGRVTVTDEKITISQDHFPGNLYMEWYGYAVGIAEEVQHA